MAKKQDLAAMAERLIEEAKEGAEHHTWDYLHLAKLAAPPLAQAYLDLRVALIEIGSGECQCSDEDCTRFHEKCPACEPAAFAMNVLNRKGT